MNKNHRRTFDRRAQVLRFFKAASFSAPTADWNVMFLGANRDAVTKAAELGIVQENSLTYAASPAGVHTMTSSAGRYVSDRGQHRKTTFSHEERRKSAES